MASINGISVKGLKVFRGHEGEPLYQGNLYLNNKKIGFWSQDSWGGSDNISLDEGYSKRLLEEAIHNLNSDKDYHGKSSYDGREFVIEYKLESLMCDLTDLFEDEKEFKNSIKKGYEGIVIASDGFNQVCWCIRGSLFEKDNDSLLEALSKDIANAKAHFVKEDDIIKHTVKVYRTLDDFVIGEPIKLSDIERKQDLNKVIKDAERDFSPANTRRSKDKSIERN